MTIELKWGVIGCGSIANEFVRSMNQYCKRKNKVVAVAASSLERANEFVKNQKLDDAKAYGSYAELIKDDNIDIVYIALLNHMHLEWTIKSLDARKHVLVEKAMGVNSREVKEIVEKAHEMNKFVMEAMCTLFLPVWSKVQEITKSKELGKVKLFHCNFGINLPSSRRVLEHGESPITDIVVYCIATTLHVFENESPSSIHVVGEKDEKGIEKYANITLRFTDDRHSIPEVFWCAEKCTKITGDFNGKRETLEFPTENPANRPFNSDGLHLEADHVYDKIKNYEIESDVYSLSTSIKVHEILDTIRRELTVEYPQDKN
ncbi:Trans-1,2-dihydrobenzene-1,2-diol dehydrogenase isoform X1 [Aphelenchoides besseyi]|nr:Trans-1,2-dihydrobenzene-1,2-diol dehydrogenase isoform X1 [Aphelenchoides besseyi]KAI6208484.1 Trans-1,2-dihydrobenzene-1,2-diol dehydrogenase isoform X1 [Aphelenchoides besseyi]